MSRYERWFPRTSPFVNTDRIGPLMPTVFLLTCEIIHKIFFMLLSLRLTVIILTRKGLSTSNKGTASVVIISPNMLLTLPALKRRKLAD